MAFLFGVLRPYALKIAAAAAIAGAVLLVLLRVHNAGRAAERIEGMSRQLDNVRKRDDVENRLAGADAAERKRLRDKWTRR